MATFKKKCVVCGTEYTYCASCPGKDPAWKMSFCSENCEEIYNICASFNMNGIPEDEACERLSKCDLSDREHFTEATQGIIARIEAIMQAKKAEAVEEKPAEPVKQAYQPKVYNTNLTKKDFRKKK